jgi:hypothetical protein
MYGNKISLMRDIEFGTISIANIEKWQRIMSRVSRAPNTSRLISVETPNSAQALHAAAKKEDVKSNKSSDKHAQERELLIWYELNTFRASS